MSATTSRSSRASRCSSAPASGADTTRFDPITSRPRTPPSSPRRPSISHADGPGGGRSSAATPHRSATTARCSGSARLAIARELVRLSGRARARPDRCPAPSGTRSRSRACPPSPSASIRLMNARTLFTPWVCCSGPRARQHDRRLAPSPSMCATSTIRVRRYAGHALDPIGPVGGDRVTRRLEPRRSLRDEVGVDQLVADRDVEQTVGQRGVAARRQLQVDVGRLRGQRAARIGDDQPSPRRALLVEVAA